MVFEHLEMASFKTTEWAAGNTTELYIYPPNSDFKSRQFLWRLSRATVMSLSSTFTPLYGVIRWIMPLDGPLSLKHKKDGKVLYRITLAPFQAHSFKGDWETESEGKVADFNLMLKEGARGHLAHVKLENESKGILSLLEKYAIKRSKQASIALYPVDGMIEIGDHRVYPGALFMIHLTHEDWEAFEQRDDQIVANEAVNVIVAEILY